MIKGGTVVFFPPIDDILQQRIKSDSDYDGNETKLPNSHLELPTCTSFRARTHTQQNVNLHR